ncbi:MAG: hypothetical protein M3132_08390, partial [Actinomycetia bacterium]|nr:hypothetical protein [Actinomycetes bacterium]
LGGIIVFLVVLDAVARMSGFGSFDRFSLDFERSIANWWAAIQLALLAVTLTVAAVIEREAGRARAAWTLMVGALAALAFSIDEIATLHEELESLGNARNVIPEALGGSSGWVFVYAVGALVIIGLTVPGIPNLLATHRTEALLIAFGATIFFLGGAVVEPLGSSLPKYAEVVIEESSELIGVAIMVWATYRLIGPVELRFRQSPV